MPGSELRLRDSKFRVLGSEFGFQGSQFRVQGLELGFRVWGLGIRVRSLGFRVQGSVFGDLNTNRQRCVRVCVTPNIPICVCVSLPAVCVSKVRN